jgi:hypothetical protein
MNTVLIMYELDPQAIILGHKEQFEVYLQSSNNFAKISETVWIIKTTTDPTHIRDDFRSLMLQGNPTPNGKIMAIDLKKNAWASFGFTEDVNSWMKNNL